MARILVIEDEPLVGHMLRRFLERAGHEVVWAPNGEVGLRRLAEGFDLVVCDLIMPGIPGEEVIRRIREEAGPPVLAVSASVSRESQRRAAGPGPRPSWASPLRPRPSCGWWRGFSGGHRSPRSRCRLGAMLGLTSEEAKKRLREYGPNALPERPAEPFSRKLLRQFQSPLIYILLLALLVDLLLWLYEGARGVPLESLVILAILLLNALLGAFQEKRSEEALKRLKALAEPSVWVLRDGRFQRLSARGLVPGDVVRLGPATASPQTASSWRGAASWWTRASSPGRASPWRRG